MKIEPMTVDHVLMMDIQDKQTEVVGLINPDYVGGLIKMGPAIAGVDGNKMVACCGCAELWQGRHLFWSVLSKEAGKHMVSIVRAANRFLELQSGRVEAVVRTDFTEAHRLVKMCGLRWHHHEERFLPGDVDADIYVRFY